MWKEFIGTNSHGNKNHCGHGNHDINDEQHKQVVDSRLVITLLDGVHDNYLIQIPMAIKHMQKLLVVINTYKTL